MLPTRIQKQYELASKHHDAVSVTRHIEVPPEVVGYHTDGFPSPTFSFLPLHVYILFIPGGERKC